MNLLNFYVPEWVFVAFNLVILILALRHILWKRVNGVLDERREKAIKAAQDSEDAAKLKTEMEQLRSKFDIDMQARTVELMKDARVRAGQEYERIVGDAEKKAEMILTDAKKKSEHEHDFLMSEAKKQVVSIAIDMSGLLLNSSMDNERNRTLLDNYLEERTAR